MSYISDTAAAAGAGASIGSALPGIGTAIGAGLGAVGSTLYHGVKSLISPNSEKTTSPDSQLSDYYINLGKVGNKKQSRALDSQSRLAALQQYYTEQNNQQDLANTYALTRDTAELQSEGKRNAGLSLAGDSTNAVSSTAPQMSSPSLPSAPMADDSMSELEQGNFIKDVSALISQIGLNKSGERKNNADASKVEIDNMTENERRLEELEQLHNENKISRVEYKRRKTALEVEQNTADDRIEQQAQETQQSQIETRIKALQEANQALQNEIAFYVRDMNKEQLSILQKESASWDSRFNADMAKIASEIKSNNANAYQSLMDGALAASNKIGVDIQNQLEREKLPYAKEVALYWKKTVRNQAALLYNQAEREAFNLGFDKEHKQTSFIVDQFAKGASVITNSIAVGFATYGALSYGKRATIKGFK